MAAETPPCSLDAVPPDLVVHALAMLDDVVDFVRAARVSSRLRELVERALLLRAAASEALGSAQPPEEGLSWTPTLLLREIRARTRHGIVSGGTYSSAIVTADGHLLTCGGPTLLTANRVRPEISLGLGIHARVDEHAEVAPVPVPTRVTRVQGPATAVAVHPSSMCTAVTTADGGAAVFGRGGWSCARAELDEEGTGVVMIACLPRNELLALYADGQMRCVDSRRAALPLHCAIPAGMLSPAHIVSVSASETHVVFVSAAGHAYTWVTPGAEPSYEALGHGEVAVSVTHPTLVESLAHSGVRIVSAAAASNRTVFASASGAVLSCGYWYFFEPDPLSADGARRPIPTHDAGAFGREGAARAVYVSASDLHTLAISTDGAVYSWGSCHHGALGHPELQDHRLPRVIDALARVRAVSVHAASCHSIVVADDGAVYTFGEGDGGKLGHGPNEEGAMSTPRPLLGVTASLLVASSPGGV